jgi:hypothetical protein
MKNNGLEDNSDKKTDVNNTSKDNKISERVMIQIQRPGQKLEEMSTIEKLLEETGIKLDPDYGPFNVNPNQGVFVVRGFASPEAQKKAKQIPGITIFPDTTISTP